MPPQPDYIYNASEIANVQQFASDHRDTEITISYQAKSGSSVEAQTSYSTVLRLLFDSSIDETNMDMVACLTQAGDGEKILKRRLSIGKDSCSADDGEEVSTLASKTSEEIVQDLVNRMSTPDDYDASLRFPEEMRDYPLVFAQAIDTPLPDSAAAYDYGKLFRNVAAFMLASVVKSSLPDSDMPSPFWQTVHQTIHEDAMNENVGANLCLALQEDELEQLGIPNDLVGFLEHTDLSTLCNRLYLTFVGDDGFNNTADKPIEHYLVGVFSLKRGE